jgi:hypothetical protein
MDNDLGIEKCNSLGCEPHTARPASPDPQPRDANLRLGVRANVGSLGGRASRWESSNNDRCTFASEGAAMIFLTAPFLNYLAWMVVAILLCAFIAVQIAKFGGK